MRGSHRLSPGTRVTRRSPTIIAAKKGKSGRTTRSMVVPATPTPTKSTLPTGGVQSPTQRFSTITMPKCTGSIPSATTTGRKMGVKMRMAGVMSMNVPTVSRMTLMRRKTTSGLSMAPTPAEIACGRLT